MGIASTHNTMNGTLVIRHEHVWREKRTKLQELTTQPSILPNLLIKPMYLPQAVPMTSQSSPDQLSENNKTNTAPFQGGHERQKWGEILTTMGSPWSRFNCSRCCWYSLPCPLVLAGQASNDCQHLHFFPSLANKTCWACLWIGQKCWEINTFQESRSDPEERSTL